MVHHGPPFKSTNDFLSLVKKNHGLLDIPKEATIFSLKVKVKPIHGIWGNPPGLKTVSQPSLCNMKHGLILNQGLLIPRRTMVWPFHRF